MNAITIQDLSKTYGGGKQALSGVNLSLEEGEIFGFLGPNGAGKTTTVKILIGLLAPSGGICRVLGLDPAAEPDKVHSCAGVVTEHAQMYDTMTGLQNLQFFGAAFGIDAALCRRRAQELLEQLELEEAGTQKLATYSTGMRQRLSLARALIHQPRVLFLDEPTSGLDPENALKVNQMIRRLAAEKGMTVFLCTHQLRYAQEICSRYGLLDSGTLLATGTLSQLRGQVSTAMTVRIKADGVPQGLACRVLEDGWFECPLHSEEEIPAIVETIVSGGGRVYRVLSDPPTLEEIYFALTAKGKEAAQ